MQEISVSHYFLEAVIRHTSRLNINVNRLLKRSGIQPTLVGEEKTRITVEQFSMLQAITMREMNDEMLGYGSSAIVYGSWSALCHWAVQTRNLGKSLTRICRFYEMIHAGVRPRIIMKRDSCILRFECIDGSVRCDPFVYELVMFCVYRFSCWLVENNLFVKEVRLSYGQPDHWREYAVLFPGAKSSFSNQFNELVLEPGILELPVKQSYQSLETFLRKPLFNLLVNNFNQNSWTAKTRTALKEQLTIMPTVNDIADKLNIHPKQLSRKLEDEGQSYSEIKSELRRDLAIQYLVKSKKTIEEIAFMVGFSETCTFTRAFKKWTGMAPFKYRKHALRI